MKKYTILILFVIANVCANAQNGVNSPYSRYGFGLLSDRSMGFNKAMAGVAQGFREGSQINIANPASYSAVDSLSALFDIGVTLQNGNFKMGSTQQNVKNSTFDYFAFQFRATKNLGITAGIMPISNIKYNFESVNEVIEGTEGVESTYNFNGSGGLREVMLGAGWQPIDGLSVGFNASYVWGDFAHTMLMSLNEISAYSVSRVYNADISTFNIQFGAQYVQPITKKDKIAIGATYTLGHSINNDAYMYTQTASSTTGSILTAIQTQTVDTATNAFQYPHTIVAGLTYYHSNTLRVGVDAELQKWSSCRFPIDKEVGETSKYIPTKGALYDRKRIALGADWTPNPMSNNYFNRVSYKIGGYYSQSYANADLTGMVKDKPYEFGISAGLSLPIQNKNANRIFANFSKVNVAIQWVHTSIPYLNAASLKQNNLTENYLKLSLGITLNEHWFYKWKLQ